MNNQSLAMHPISLIRGIIVVLRFSLVTVNRHCLRCQSVQVCRHGKNPKGQINFAAVTVTGCFSSLTVTRSVIRELKTKSLKWLSTVPEFAILNRPGNPGD
ncbi:hypothetical protein QUQ56_002644 [Escherichia coli]|nr:hypothetical protein [Escherichia coli]